MSQLHIASLGRPFSLGMLYDCRTESIIPGKTLWKAETLKSVSQVEQTPSSSYKVITEDTIKSKCCHLDISGNLKLSLLSGLVEVRGAAKFFHEKKSSEQVSRVSLKYTSTTHFEQLTMDQIGHLQFPKVLEDQDATHMVTGIEYGADAFFIFDRIVSEDEKISEIKGNMEVAIKCIPKICAGTSADTTMKHADKEETDKFQCKFHGDLILPYNPSTFDEAVEIYKNLPKLLEGKKAPKQIHLCSLKTLVPGKDQRIIYHQVSSILISKVEEITEYFSHAEVRVSDLLKHDTCTKFYDITTQLLKFDKLLTQHKISFISELTRILPSIRSGNDKEGK